MADGVSSSTGSLLSAAEVARSLVLKRAPNGLRYVAYGETKILMSDLERLVQAVPATVAPALNKHAFYFVPLALPPERARGTAGEGSIQDESPTLIADAFTAELADEAVCHRNVTLAGRDGAAGTTGVFISSRLLNDKFALSFEFFINVGHLFAEAVGVPEAFSNLVWTQALADVRGETSQDAWEARGQSLPQNALTDPSFVDEKAKLDYFESAFADALAIYQLSLAVDFDYSELREREYPLLAPAALAERLRLVATLFPPNANYDFSIRYRRRA